MADSVSATTSELQNSLCCMLCPIPHGQPELDPGRHSVGDCACLQQQHRYAARLLRKDMLMSVTQSSLCNPGLCTALAIAACIIPVFHRAVIVGSITFNLLMGHILNHGLCQCRQACGEADGLFVQTLVQQPELRCHGDQQ